MVKGCVGPRRCRVARLAIRRKAAQNVIRIRGALKVLHVAGGAGGIRGGQIVVVVHMAGSTWHAHVRSRERKPRCAVVKVCLKPRIHPVARLAICGKAGSDVVRVDSVLKIPRVARIAVG